MGKTILIVDDSASVRELVGFTLEKAGYTVLRGTDGQDALQHLGNKDIKLVITDLHMPNLDGIGLLTEIRKDETHRFVPVILLTTESQASKKLDAKEAGATGWLVKPFAPEKLLEVVQKVIR